MEPKTLERVGAAAWLDYKLCVYSEVSGERCQTEE